MAIFKKIAIFYLIKTLISRESFAKLFKDINRLEVFK